LQLKEELAKKATDKYRKIINSMDEGFCLIEIIRDPSGACVDYKYVETNPVFELQTGLKDVTGKTVNELVPDLEPFWKETYGNVASTGESIRFEDYAQPMGRWFDVNSFRIDSPDEQHVAIIFKEITER
ncbi:PAS domain-containing protein, partial [Salinimicrobium oceani]